MGGDQLFVVAVVVAVELDPEAGVRAERVCDHWMFWSEPIRHLTLVLGLTTVIVYVPLKSKCWPKTSRGLSTWK